MDFHVESMEACHGWVEGLDCENIELLCDLIMVIDFFGALKSVGKPPWVGCCQN